MMRSLSLSLVFLGACFSAASANANLNIPGHLEDLPDTGLEWQTLEDGSEFQPSEEHIRYLKRRSSSASTSGYENIFVDGTGTYYNDYAQAWRLLGFYIDCNAPLNNVNECYGEGGGGGGGKDENDQPACQRYLLWAAVSKVHLYYSILCFVFVSYYICKVLTIIIAIIIL